MKKKNIHIYIYIYPLIETYNLERLIFYFYNPICEFAENMAPQSWSPFYQWFSNPLNEHSQLLPQFSIFVSISYGHRIYMCGQDRVKAVCRIAFGVYSLAGFNSSGPYARRVLTSSPYPSGQLFVCLRVYLSPRRRRRRSRGNRQLLFSLCNHPLLFNLLE